uniref:Cysteine synthase n=1 Tax=Syphacia muris TaxID=451379 RepID=A0A0N5AIH8_9BILA
MSDKELSGKIAASCLDITGNTPMIYLNKITKDCVAKIAVKLEYMSPAGSVKDRIANAMIEQAEKQGKLRPNVSIIIEPTSGNNGISLAHVAAIKGYKLVLVMPESMSLERRMVMMAFGAEVVLTKAKEGMRGCISKAKELAERIPNSFMPNQFKNPINPQIHYETTGPEIWKQTGGKVDIAVFGVGSGGTLTGAGKYLLEQNPNIEIVACEPEEAAILSGGEFEPHSIPGMGAGFVPQVLDTTIYKSIIRVHSKDAIEMSRRLTKEEGILAGIASGAQVCAALKLAKEPRNKGKLIVTNITSFGERYLSTNLYADIRERATDLKVESTEESVCRLPFVSY